MSAKPGDIFTVPNVLTAGRLTASPYVAKKLHDNPKKWWLPAGLFAASDVVDGFLARSGEKSPALRRLGFRTSEIGRKLDPVTDKIVISEFVGAGIHKGIIPKSLGAVTLAQKVLVSGVSLAAEKAGADIQVTQLGKKSEFMTNLGLGTLFIAESIEDPSTKNLVRTVGIGAAALGVAGAFAATADYARQAVSQPQEQ